MKKNLYLVFSSIFNQALRFLSVFILMIETSPEIYSQWVTISIIMQYSLFLQLGSPQAMHREVAILAGKKDEAAKEKIIFSAIVNYLISMLVVSLLLFIFNNDKLLVPTIIYISLIHLGNLFLLQTRAKFHIKRAAAAMFIDGLLLFTFALYLIPIHGVLGLIASLCIGSFANIIICFPTKIFRLVLAKKINNIFKNLFFLVKEGLPLLVFNFLILLKESWDYIFIRFFYIDDYVLYSSSHIFVRGVSVLGSLVGLIFIPLLAKNFGQTNQIYNSENKTITKKLLINLYIGALILISLWYALSDIFVKTLLINFSDSIDIIAYRTITSMLGLTVLPVYFFYNSSRATILSIKFTFASIIISIVIFFIISNFFNIAFSIITSMFIGNLILIVFMSLYFFNRADS
jgi:O-antigen/teichoic acid export membrane protein